MARFSSMLCVRTDQQLNSIITEAWRIMKFHRYRSDVVRDLIKIGYATITGTRAELTHGQTIIVNNPQVHIRVPARWFRHAKPAARGYVETAIKKLDRLEQRLRKLVNIVRVENNMIVARHMGYEISLSPRELRQNLVDMYRELTEIRELLNLALAEGEG